MRDFLGAVGFAVLAVTFAVMLFSTPAAPARAAEPAADIGVSAEALHARRIAPAATVEQSAFLGKALAELQQQRNTALDEAVNARAQLAMALQRIAELEKRAETKEAK